MKKVFSPATINRLKKEGVSEKEIEEVSKQVADLALSLEDHLLTDHQIELEDDVELTLRPFIDSGLEQYVNWYAVLIFLFQEKLAEVGWSQFRQMISDASTT